LLRLKPLLPLPQLQLCHNPIREDHARFKLAKSDAKTLTTGETNNGNSADMTTEESSLAPTGIRDTSKLLQSQLLFQQDNSDLEEEYART